MMRASSGSDASSQMIIVDPDRSPPSLGRSCQSWSLSFARHGSLFQSACGSRCRTLIQPVRTIRHIRHRRITEIPPAGREKCGLVGGWVAGREETDGMPTPLLSKPTRRLYPHPGSKYLHAAHMRAWRGSPAPSPRPVPISSVAAKCTAWHGEMITN